MKKVVVFSVLFFLLFTTLRAQTISQQSVYFDSDQYILKEEFKKQLNDFNASTKGYSECIVSIVGHTDQDGDLPYNLELSKKRAETVKNELMKLGFPESDIVMSYRGESELLFEQSDNVSKQKNRRVTLLAEGFTYNTPIEMVTQIELEDNTEVTINIKEASELKLKQGTEVSIPIDAFCHLDGTPIESDQVQMKFKEAFEYASMIDERLFTQTDDQILETGGMIYIEASADGKPLKLKNGKSIDLVFPDQEIKSGMELFIGSEDENGIIWEESGEAITNRSSNTRPDIRVDLSPLLDFQIDYSKPELLSFAPMPEYPHPVKTPYPPFKDNYTEDGYAVALKKYEAAMQAYEEDKVDRPERLAAWIKEAKERRDVLMAHNKAHIKFRYLQMVQQSMSRLQADKDRISHERLIDILFLFLNNSVAEVNYDKYHYMKLAYGSELVDVKKEIFLNFYDYKYYQVKQLFPELNERISSVRTQILDRKYELGYIDKALMGRYVMSSSSLGWINCDRFQMFTDDRKTDLEFARLSEGDQFYLIFKGMKSIIRPSSFKEKVVFSGVPKGEEVRLIAIHEEEGDITMAMHDFTIDKNKDTKLTYKPTGIRQLRKALEI